jgi:hypothetical protein
MLSSFAPKSLSCFRILASRPSSISLMPQYRYIPQKGSEKGVVKQEYDSTCNASSGYHIGQIVYANHPHRISVCPEEY